MPRGAVEWLTDCVEAGIVDGLFRLREGDFAPEKARGLFWLVDPRWWREELETGERVSSLHAREVAGDHAGGTAGRARDPVRDEAANLAWGVEESYEGPTGTAIARRVNEHLHHAELRFFVSQPALEAASCALVDAGLEVAGLYHSHVDRGAAYPPDDCRRLELGAAHLIVAVRRGRFEEARAWRGRPDRVAMDELTLEVI